jgi:hypothetical protein
MNEIHKLRALYSIGVFDEKYVFVEAVNAAPSTGENPPPYSNKSV